MGLTILPVTFDRRHLPTQVQQLVSLSAVAYAFGSLQGCLLWFCCGGELLGDNYSFFKYETCYWKVIFGDDEERKQELQRRKERDVFSEKAISATTGTKDSFFINADSTYRVQMLSRPNPSAHVLNFPVIGPAVLTTQKCVE